MKSSITKDNAPGFRILNTTTCPSLSGKTKLTYQIACNDESEVHFRIIANTNPGCFNTDWVSLKAIQTAFAKNLHGDVVTGDTLLPLYRGKSLNTSFFICAALKNEGLIDNHPEKKRCYAAMDPGVFMAEVQALIDGKVTAKTPAKKKTAKRNASTAKKTTPRKKAKRSPA